MNCIANFSPSKTAAHRNSPNNSFVMRLIAWRFEDDESGLCLVLIKGCQAIQQPSGDYRFDKVFIDYT